jgi:DNA repair protein RadC
LQAALEIGRRNLQAKIQRLDVMTHARETGQFLMAKMRSYQQEVFACLFLDSHHRVIIYEELFYGTIDGAAVHPRIVIKRALFHNAAAVIFAHNHPSGIAEPSEYDKQLTLQLKTALSLVDIKVLDHFIIGDGHITSLLQMGMI